MPGASLVHGALVALGGLAILAVTARFRYLLPGALSGRPDPGDRPLRTEPPSRLRARLRHPRLQREAGDRLGDRLAQVA